MSLTVWKYPLEVSDVMEVLMPTGARILTVDVQRDVPTLWVLVDPSAQSVKRRLFVEGTGHTVKGGEYVGSFQWLGDQFVGHVFDAGEIA